MKRNTIMIMLHLLALLPLTSFSTDTSHPDHIQSLSDQLHKEFSPAPLKSNKLTPNESNFVEYPFSNENGPLFWFSPFSSVIYQVKQGLPPILEHHLPHTAILVGQSSLPALLPALSGKINHVIFLDISSGLLNYNMAYISILKHWAAHDYPEGTLREETLSEYRNIMARQLAAIFYLKDQSWLGFMARFFVNTRLSVKVYDQLHDYHDAQMAELGLFNNFENMKNLMENIESISFSPVRVNLANAAAMKKLGAILKEHRARVLLINTSNAYEWIHLSTDDHFQSINHLNFLPLEENHGLFAYSCLKFCGVTKLALTARFNKLFDVIHQYQSCSTLNHYSH